MEAAIVGSGSYEQSWRAIPTQRPGPECYTRNRLKVQGSGKSTVMDGIYTGRSSYTSGISGKSTGISTWFMFGVEPNSRAVLTSHEHELHGFHASWSGTPTFSSFTGAKSTNSDSSRHVSRGCYLPQDQYGQGACDSSSPKVQPSGRLTC